MRPFTTAWTRHQPKPAAAPRVETDTALRREAAGQCPRCGHQHPPGPRRRALCDPCAAKHNENCRNRYRQKRGIPLDAPISPRGNRIS